MRSQVHVRVFFLERGVEGGEWIFSTKRCGKHANCKADRVSIMDDYQGVTTPFIPAVDTVE